jgi:hypothetical protein
VQSSGRPAGAGDVARLVEQVPGDDAAVVTEAAYEILDVGLEARSLRRVGGETATG